MSRSIHTTTRDLTRERRFARSDDVPETASITVIERQDIQKRARKINARWKRKAQRVEAVAHAKILVTDVGPKRIIQKAKGQLSVGL